MNELTSREVEDRYFQLVDKAAYAQALELVTQHVDLFPDHAQGVVYFWRMEMACHLNDVALALQLLEEAVADGHWYAKLDENPDFQLLRGLPRFERLVAACTELRAVAIADADPVLQVLQPDDRPPPYPLLLALHGNSSNIESFASHWQTAVACGWLVGLPQSPQAYGPGTYSWNDWDWVIPEVEKHYLTLCEQYPVDPGRAILAGFSMGAGLAIWLTLNGAIPVRGIIGVAPFLSNIDNLLPVLERRQRDSMRVYLVATERDEYCYGVARRLMQLLPDYGIACELDVYADLEHSFPPSFEQELPCALDFVLAE